MSARPISYRTARCLASGSRNSRGIPALSRTSPPRLHPPNPIPAWGMEVARTGLGRLAARTSGPGRRLARLGSRRGSLVIIARIDLVVLSASRLGGGNPRGDG